MRLNKIIGAFGNIDKILEGVKNKVFKRQDVEDIADIRWMQCARCPELDEKGDNCAVNGTQPCCTACGCSLSIKLRALSSSCPKGKWAPVTDKYGEQKIKQQILEDRNTKLKEKSKNKKDASNI
jgi:hypothetical protein